MSHYDIGWGGVDPTPGWDDPEWGECSQSESYSGVPALAGTFGTGQSLRGRVGHTLRGNRILVCRHSPAPLGRDRACADELGTLYG